MAEPMSMRKQDAKKVVNDKSQLNGEIKEFMKWWNWKNSNTQNEFYKQFCAENLAPGKFREMTQQQTGLMIFMRDHQKPKKSMSVSAHDGQPMISC